MSTPLGQLMTQDEAHHLEITYEDGVCVLVATIDDFWDEIAVYDDIDLDPEVIAQANALEKPSGVGDDEALHWPPGTEVH